MSHNCPDHGSPDPCHWCTVKAPSFVRPICPQPYHGSRYMHGDTLLCLKCGGLVSPAEPAK